MRILEGGRVQYKSSHILEPWIDIYIDEKYCGTIPVEVFNREFRSHSSASIE